MGSAGRAPCGRHFKLADHSREPGCVGEGAVDEDDGGTRHGRFSSGWRGAPTTLRHRTRASRPRGSPPGTQPVVLCRSTAMRPPPASRTSRQQGRLKTGSSAWPVTSHEIADSECACNDDHPPAPAMRARWRPGCVAADQATRAQVPLQGPLGRRHARTRRGAPPGKAEWLLPVLALASGSPQTGPGWLSRSISAQADSCAPEDVSTLRWELLDRLLTPLTSTTCATC